MTNTAQYTQARKEGRLCERCFWIATKKDFEAGHRLCSACRDALKGVQVTTGAPPYADEPMDMTGES